MILKIVFVVLILIALAASLFFLFVLFLPSLNAQRINAEDPLYAKEELDAVLNKTEFKRAKTGLIAHVFTDRNAQMPEKELVRQTNDCSIFVMTYGSGVSSCVGIGNCSRVCPRKAIVITKRGAEVRPDCNGCGLCIDVCPLSLIQLVSLDKKVVNSTIVAKKDFQFFQKCYRMFSKGKNKE